MAGEIVNCGGFEAESDLELDEEAAKTVPYSSTTSVAFTRIPSFVFREVSSSEGTTVASSAVASTVIDEFAFLLISGRISFSILFISSVS